MDALCFHEIVVPMTAAEILVAETRSVRITLHLRPVIKDSVSVVRVLHEGDF
jgi:hypothetical protein